MNKKTLITYIKGEATREQKEAVLNWIDQSPYNKQYLASLKLTHIALDTPKQEASKEELNEIKAKIAKRTQDKQNEHYKKKNILITIMSSCIAACLAALAVFIARPSDIQLKASITQELISNLKEKEITIALEEMPANSLNTIYTEKGVKGEVGLPDGSRVILNSGTKLSYPNKFIGATREVMLIGEGYFKVKKDSLHPMIVNTGKNFKIQVLGTEFNLKNYADDMQSQATLYSGSINLISYAHNHDKSVKESITKVLPNQCLTITTNKGVSVNTPEDIQIASAWKDGRLIFEESPMPEVIKTLERWHGVRIVVKDDKILKYNITAQFNSESIVQIMDMMKFCAPIDYKVENKEQSVHQINIYAR
ncbi:MAG: DUF4974 domain-containing protein [Bacteroidales bacterium]